MAGHSGSGSRTGSTPFPQLLPGLDECLHLSGTRKTVVNQPAILKRLLVKITNRRHAEVREVVTEFFEVLLAQNLRLLAIRTARHLESDSNTFVFCSPTMHNGYHDHGRHNPHDGSHDRPRAY